MRNRITRRAATILAAIGLVAVAVTAGATTATADAYGGNLYNSYYSVAHVVYQDRYSGANKNLYPGSYAGQDRVVVFRVPSGRHALLYYNYPTTRYVGCLEGGSVYYPRGVGMHTVQVYDGSRCYQG